MSGEQWCSGEKQRAQDYRGHSAQEEQERRERMVAGVSVQCATARAAAEAVFQQYAVTTRPAYVEVTIPADADRRLITSTEVEAAVRRLHAEKLAAAGSYGTKPPALTSLTVELAWTEPGRDSRIIIWL